MKRLILILTTMAFIIPSFSQTRIEVGVYTAMNKDMSAASYYSNRLPGPDGYSFGIKGAYNLKPKFDVQAGLLYTKMDSRTNPNIFRCGTEPVTEPLLVQDVQSDNLELQTALRYKVLGNARITPFISAGFAQFFKARRQTNLSDSPEWTWQSADKRYQGYYNAALLASVGARVNLSKRLALDVEPSVKYFPVSDDYLESKFNVCSGIGLAYKLTD